MTKGDVSILVALASVLSAPFSPFLGARSLRPLQHPSVPPLHVSGIGPRAAGSDVAAAPPLPLAASSLCQRSEQQTLC